MPFYRIGGAIVHMRGTKMPPACTVKVGFSSLPGDSTVCLGVSAYLCDWPVGEGGTCDRPLCATHAHQVGKNRHYCPDHRAEGLRRQPQLGLFTALTKDTP